MLKSLLSGFVSHVKTHRARGNLYQFVKQAWPLVEGRTSFKDGWHVQGVCAHLEGVVSGRVGDLLVNVPPGCMKTLLASVFWPCWTWLRHPGSRWLFASYSQELSVRDSLARRKILTSPWYRGMWSASLRAGENRQLRYYNSAGGWMLATSVAGPATGEHPDYVVVDDPHSALQAESECERENAKAWWDSTISTRGVVRGVKRVVVMQRLHRRDLSGHLLEQGTFTHLCLPMEYEPDRMSVSPLGWRDRRTEPGELLWEPGFTAEKVSRLKRSLPPDRWEAQMQQRPPEQAAGAEFPASYFQDSIWFDEWPVISGPQYRVIALDPSVGRTESSDDSAFVMLLMDVEQCRFWVEADLQRRDATSLGTRAVELTREFRPHDVVVEANGFQGLLCISMRQAFERAGLTTEIHPIINTAPKGYRIKALSGPLSRGELFFRRTRGTETLVEQLRLFPTGSHDDGPDALEMAVRRARQRMEGTGDDVSYGQVMT